MSSITPFIVRCGRVPMITSLQVKSRRLGASNEPPVASFTYDTNDGLRVAVTNTSSDDVAIVAWTWSWGDGSPDSTEENPAPHEYPVNGTYPLRLTVEDEDGAIHLVEHDVELETVYPADEAEWAEWAGFNELDAYWRFTQASGDCPDIVGNADLTSVNSPIQNVDDVLLNSKCVEFTVGSFMRMAAADATVLDVGSNDFFLWWCGRYTAVTDDNPRGLMNKRDTDDGFAGYDLQTTPAGRIRHQLDDGDAGGNDTDTEDLDFTTDTNPMLIGALVDRNANNQQTFALQDGVVISSGGQAIASGDLTNDDGVFGFGHCPASDARAAPARVSAGGKIIGVDARAFTAAKLLELGRRMRLPLTYLPYPANGDALAEMAELAIPPVGMWRFSPGAGPFVDTEDDNDFVISSSSGYTLGGRCPKLGGKALRIADNSTGAMAVADTGAFDVDLTTSIAILIIWELITAPGAARMVFGKGTAPGYRTVLNTDRTMNWYMPDGVLDITKSSPAYTLNVPNHTIFLLNRSGLGNVGIYDQNGGAAPSGQGGLGSLSNASSFKWGNVGLANNAGMNVALMAIFRAAGAEQDLSGAVAAIRTAQGLS